VVAGPVGQVGEKKKKNEKFCLKLNQEKFVNVTLGSVFLLEFSSQLNILIHEHKNVFFCFLSRKSFSDGFHIFLLPKAQNPFFVCH